jgi:hypothetical protein
MIIEVSIEKYLAMKLAMLREALNACTIMHSSAEDIF